MRKLLSILFFCFVSHLDLYSQEGLFLVNKESEICATIDKKNTQGLNLDSTIYSRMLKNKYEVLILDFPFFEANLSLRLNKFNVYSKDLSVISKLKRVMCC